MRATWFRTVNEAVEVTEKHMLGGGIGSWVVAARVRAYRLASRGSL